LEVEEMKRFEIGETVYITNMFRVLKGIIIAKGSGFYTIQFSEGKGTRLRANRLIKDEKEALKIASQHGTPFKEYEDR
jgi:hypothetical protein